LATKAAKFVLVISFNFCIFDIADRPLKELAQKVLELASLYSTVVRFVEQKASFRYGRVNNALSAAMDEHILDYLVKLVN
jgi:Gamma tubulin complex component N-terminal